MKGVFRAPERREISLTKGHPELHFLSLGHSEGFEQALPGYYSIADTNECQPAAAAATTDKERLRRLPEPQTVDKVKSAVIFLQKGEEPKGKEGGSVEIKRVEAAKEKEAC